jgi:UDP-N-acetylmuramate--alanine ligase
LGAFHLAVPGAHNVLNATAAIAVALELEVPVDEIRAGLASFSGVDRRFQIRGVEGGVTVVDDYGHHPTEVRATLATARVTSAQRVLVLFQPHRYTRTAALLEEFARSFHQADVVMVLDIYAASEKPIEGVDAQVLVEKLRDYGHRGADYAGSMDEGIRRMAEEARPGDCILTLGAGSVSQAGDRILEALRARQRS